MKCKCKDCGKTIEQDAMEPAFVVNPADPEHCFVLCEECREKRGFTIISCEHCTELSEAVRLQETNSPEGFTPCPSCGHDVYSGKQKEDYTAVKCRKCGKIIHLPDEDGRVINEGLASEYIVCEPCFDSMWDLNQIVKCDGCGRWYENGALVKDPDVADFTPCPNCGVDVCEGYSRADAIELMRERQQCKAPRTPQIPQYRENAEAVIFELANIITENHHLRKENSDLRLRVAKLEALEEGKRTGDYAKYDFLAEIEAQNMSFDLHRASGWISSAERVDDWEQKLAEFMHRRKREKNYGEY